MRSLMLQCSLAIFAAQPLATIAQDVLLRSRSSASRITVTAELSAVGNVDPREVSFALDNYFLKKGNCPLDLADPRLRNLVSEFQPFVLRVSGTGAEDLIFGEDPEAYVEIPTRVQQALRGFGGGTDLHNVSIDAYDALANFVRATDADFVLGFNQLLRGYDAGYNGCDGPGLCYWMSRNAEAWMQHNVDIGVPVYGYELGNEPGCYMPDVKMDSSHVKRDFVTFKAAIEKVHGTNGPKVIGPDVGGCKHADYLDEVLLAEKPPLDIVTIHHYVLGNAGKHNYTVADYINAAKSNITRDEFRDYAAARDSHLPGVPLWHGEGATTWGNIVDKSLPGLSSFAFGYNYINILGQGGLNSMQVFAKQALNGLFARDAAGQYEPVAPFWVALLWKRLMGTTVYHAATSGEGHANVIAQDNLLAFARSGRSYGSVAFALANLGEKRLEVPVYVGSDRICDVYELSPASEPRDTAVLMNGETPPVNADGSVSQFVPMTMGCGEVSVSPLAISFVVVH